MADRLRGLLEATHRQWNSPDERRRMRAFGFRPAVEPGVLKREWHGLAVRVSAGGVRAARPGSGELAWLADTRTLLLDGEPYPGGGAGIDLIESVLDLISAYERWVEAREGREGRMQRGRTGPPTGARSTPSPRPAVSSASSRPRGAGAEPGTTGSSRPQVAARTGAARGAGVAGAGRPRSGGPRPRRAVRIRTCRELRRP